METLQPKAKMNLTIFSLIAEGENMGETLVILQRFRPDNLFSKQQQERLQELMEVVLLLFRLMKFTSMMLSHLR